MYECQYTRWQTSSQFKSKIAQADFKTLDLLFNKENNNNNNYCGSSTRTNV